MREGRGYDLSIMKFRFAKTFQPSSRPALLFEIEKGKKGRGRKREALIQRGAAKEGVDLGKHTRGHPFRSVNANRYRPCREFLRRPLFQPVVRRNVRASFSFSRALRLHASSRKLSSFSFSRGFLLGYFVRGERIFFNFHKSNIRVLTINSISYGTRLIH